MTSGVAIVDVTLEATATVPMNSVLIQSAGDGAQEGPYEHYKRRRSKNRVCNMQPAHTKHSHLHRSPSQISVFPGHPGACSWRTNHALKIQRLLPLEVLDRCQNHWCSNKNCIYSCGGRLTLLLEAEDAYRPVFSLSRFATSVL